MSESNLWYWNPTGGPGGTGNWEKVEGADGGILTEPRKGAGEEALGTSAEHQAVVDRCSATRWNFSSGAEKNGSVSISNGAPALLVGYIVWVLPATNPVKIRDGSSAAGTDKGDIPTSGVTVGQFVPFKGAKFNTGIYVDLNSATNGDVTFLWQAQS